MLPNKSHLPIDSSNSPKTFACHLALLGQSAFGLGLIGGRFLGASILIKTLQQAAVVLNLSDNKAFGLGLTFSICYGLINLGQGSEIALPIGNHINWQKYYRGTPLIKSLKLLSLIPMIATQNLTAIGASVGTHNLLTTRFGVDDTIATLLGLWALFSTAKLWSYYFPHAFDMVERLALFSSYRRFQDSIPSDIESIYQLDAVKQKNKVFLNAYKGSLARNILAICIGICGVLNSFSYAGTLSVGYKSQLTEEATLLMAYGTVICTTLATLLAFRYMQLYKIFYDDSECVSSSIKYPKLWGAVSCLSLTIFSTTLGFLSTNYFVSQNMIWPLVGIGALFTFLAYLTRTVRIFDAFNPDSSANDDKNHWTKPMAMLTTNGYKSALLWPFSLPIIGYSLLGGYFILSGGFNNLCKTLIADKLDNTWQEAIILSLAALCLLPFVANTAFMGGLSLLNFGHTLIKHSTNICHMRTAPTTGSLNDATPLLKIHSLTTREGSELVRLSTRSHRSIDVVTSQGINTPQA